MGGVVEDDVEDEAHSPGMGFPDQDLEVLEISQIGIDSVIINN